MSGKERWHLGDGSVLSVAPFGYPCVPALGQVHVAPGGFGLVYSLPKNCLDVTVGVSGFENVL